MAFLRSPVFSVAMSAVAVAFCLLWILGDRSTKRDTVIVELGPIANGPTFSMPVFVNFRRANGKEMFATILHDELDPSVFTLTRGTYLVSVEQCGGKGWITTSSVTLVQVIFLTHPVRGRTVCIVRPG
jgi:hypothetical protein